MQPPIKFIYQGLCADCGRYTDRGMAAANGLVVCASCFQQQSLNGSNASRRKNMATYDKAMERAKALAKETGESYFIFHQPEAWETCDTGWHVIDQTEYYYSVSVIDEQTVCCSVTWDEEANDYSIDQFEPWYCSTWQEE